PARRGSGVGTASVVLVLAAVAGTAVLFVREQRANARQVEQLQRDLVRGPVVRVARVRLAPAERVVSLPAEVRADRRAVLYAKVSGYVKKVMVDRGDRVKEGQQLAMLESPDLDQQVAAAEAEVTLRRQQLQRALRLVGRSMSQNDREQAEEAVKVAQSALDRARVMKGYDTLRAPFDGTVVARYADPGALLPAATGSTSSAQPLLEVAQLDGDPRPLVPAEALVAQGGQIYVAIVQDGHVKLQRIRAGNDDGATVEVLEGLHGGEYVALNLGTEVADGSPVRVQEAPAAQTP